MSKERKGSYGSYGSYNSNYKRPKHRKIHERKRQRQRWSEQKHTRQLFTTTRQRKRIHKKQRRRDKHRMLLLWTTKTYCRQMLVERTNLQHLQDYNQLPSGHYQMTRECKDNSKYLLNPQPQQLYSVAATATNCESTGSATNVRNWIISNNCQQHQSNSNRRPQVHRPNTSTTMGNTHRHRSNDKSAHTLTAVNREQINTAYDYLSTATTVTATKTSWTYDYAEVRLRYIGNHFYLKATVFDGLHSHVDYTPDFTNWHYNWYDEYNQDNMVYGLLHCNYKMMHNHYLSMETTSLTISHNKKQTYRNFKTLTTPTTPSQSEIDEHNITHLPCRDWC
eukprot:205596-Amphidinium_carterae.2